MKRLVIDPSAVIAMDHFAHQPEILLHLSSLMTHSLHEIKIKHICRIQTDSIDIKRIDPETNHIIKILHYRRITLIQLHQKIVAAPVLIGKAIVILIIATKIHITEPITVLGSFTVLLQILKGKEASSDMIKHTVHNDLYSHIMTIVHKVSEILIGTKADVHLLVIRCLIAMSHRLKKRSDVNCRKAQITGMLCPLFQLPEMALWDSCVLFAASAKSQRIDVIKYCTVIPCHSFPLSALPARFILCSSFCH